VRKVEIKLGSYEGQVAFFHGIFQVGNLEHGCDPVAVVEFPDGSMCEFAISYIRFLSQPAERQREICPNAKPVFECQLSKGNICNGDRSDCSTE
jgi:hypothetical protein